MISVRLIGIEGSRYHRPTMVHGGPSSGFSLIMQMLVSSFTCTVGSNGICRRQSRYHRDNCILKDHILGGYAATGTSQGKNCILFRAGITTLESNTYLE